MSAKVYLMMMVTFLVLCQVVSEKVSKEKMDTVDEKTISVGFFSTLIHYVTSESGLRKLTLKLLEYAAYLIMSTMFTVYF